MAIEFSITCPAPFSSDDRSPPAAGFSTPPGSTDGASGLPSEMSTALSPSTPMLASCATESPRTRSMYLADTWSWTCSRGSFGSGEKKMPVTFPTFRPPSHTGDSSFSPCTLLK